MNGTEQRNHKTALEALRGEITESIEATTEVLATLTRAGEHAEEQLDVLAERAKALEERAGAIEASAKADREQAMAMDEAQGREIEILRRMVKPLIVGLKEHDEWVATRRRFWPRVWWMVSGK